MRTERFTFLCTIEERGALERLAGFWRRSKSDTIRLLIVNALEQLFAVGEQREEEATKSRTVKPGEFHPMGPGARG